MATIEDTARALIEVLAEDSGPEGRIGKPRRYLQGKHNLPYMPHGVKKEYEVLAEKSITNWLPLVSSTFAHALFVEGYRPEKSADNATAWDHWQANGLDARQSIAHRGALDYGVSYVLVLPGKPSPVIKPFRGNRAVAWYEDDDADWPTVGLCRIGKTMDGGILYELYDDKARYLITRRKRQNDAGYSLEVGEPEKHSLGITPLIRFRTRLDDESLGVISPLITIQDRINEVVFVLSMALQYAAHRQRWATGLAIPVDTEETLPGGGANPNVGKPVEPFQAAVDRLWVSDSPEARFGEFGQTDVSGHLSAYMSAVRTLAATGQISPNIMTGDLVNLSADALAQLESATTAQLDEFAVLFGESWEQVLRLAAKAAGDSDGAADTSAQVRWRDTEARSMAQTVDALGKIAQMLKVPVEELWEKIPGVTQTDVERWKETAGKSDGLALLADALNRQSEPAPGQEGAPPAEAA